MEIDVLADEARAIEKAALRAAVLDLYLPGDDEPRRVAMDVGSFDQLATDQDEINKRLAGQGIRTISLADPGHVERYGLAELARSRVGPG